MRMLEVGGCRATARVRGLGFARVSAMVKGMLDRIDWIC
jgi:hypothetical protein